MRDDDDPPPPEGYETDEDAVADEAWAEYLRAMAMTNEEV